MGGFGGWEVEGTAAESEGALECEGNGAVAVGVTAKFAESANGPGAANGKVGEEKATVGDDDKTAALYGLKQAPREPCEECQQGEHPCGEPPKMGGERLRKARVRRSTAIIAGMNRQMRNHHHIHGGT